MTQVTDSWSSIPSTVVNIIKNKIGAFDDAVILQTGDYEYTAQIENKITGAVEQIRVYRTSSSGYSTYWSTATTSIDEMSYTCNNEYYAYSTIGFGQPIIDNQARISSIANVSIMCFLVLAVFFGMIFGRRR